jgi:hypothetical protein
MTRRALLALVAVVALAIAASASPLPAPAGWLLDQVKILTGPEMEGRESGTAGGERAAQHIVAELRAAGLAPLGAGASYRAEFPVPTRVRLAGANHLTLTGPASRDFRLGTDWSPTGGSADGQVEAGIVFVGYGISELDLAYDEYASVDVRGKIALALAGEPRRDDPASPFARGQAGSYGQRLYKARVARDHGARALLLVSRPHAGSDSLPPLRGASGGDLVTAAITRATAEAVLEAGGYHLDELRDQIERTLTPMSRPLPGVRARLAVQLVRESGVAANIIAILPGTDPQRAKEAVVVGAHYDHLGRSGDFSLDTDRLAVHPGADDNASGTAAVLGLARAFAAAGRTPRTLVFAFFAGEEMGLLGAGAYVRSPGFPLERTVAMVNLDMVGRLRDRRVFVGGVGSASDLEPIVRAAVVGLDLDLTLWQTPYGPSDHASFYQHGIPVLFLHTGVHEDYHRTTDTWEKINAPGLERIVTFAHRIVDRLAGGPAPVYAKVPRERVAPVMVYTGSGAGFFGIAPDGADDAPGVRLAMVQPGSPADQAGVRPGDVVLRFGGVRVYTLDEVRDVLEARKPGDTVDVVYLRDGVEHRTRAVLAARPGS